MEKELKEKARKKTILSGVIFNITALIILFIIFIGIFEATKVFYFSIMLYIFIVFFILSLLYIMKNLIFISKSQFTYGKVIKIEKSNPKLSDVYQNFTIEYIDDNTNQSYQTIVYEHFGDNDDELDNEINTFYEEGQKLLNKKVPVLYIKNRPDKTVCFLDRVENLKQAKRNL